jgi:hypothetical protein
VDYDDGTHKREKRERKRFRKLFSFSLLFLSLLALSYWPSSLLLSLRILTFVKEVMEKRRIETDTEIPACNGFLLRAVFLCPFQNSLLLSLLARSL